ncbi:hypothetical protein LguiA_008395 [Lonicera macranthoides]
MEAIRRKQLLLVFLVALFLVQTASGDHFVLVHGGGLGAWSWFKLVPRLWSYGHKVTAFDLAAAGVDPRQVTDIPSIADYFKPLRDYMAALPSQEKVILVGHSQGGLAISQSMELFPQKIKVAVFVTAFMPGPNYNISTLNQDDWVLATLLSRPSRVYSEQDMSNVLKLSTEKYGSVNRVFIISGQDKILIPSFQRLMVTRNPPTEVQEIATSDHIVMISRVDELSEIIDLKKDKASFENSKAEKTDSKTVFMKSDLSFMSAYIFIRRMKSESSS